MTLTTETRSRLTKAATATATDPDSLVLAHLTCTPPMVPYPLLRRLRRALLPDLRLDAEARLCASPLVDGVAMDGYTLSRDVVAGFRGTLRSALEDEMSDGHGDTAQIMRTALDAEIGGLSPLLQLEEQICWLWMTEVAAKARIDSLLADVVLTVARERRTQILVWAAAALSRLPLEAVNGSAGWTLAQLCRAARLFVPHIEWPAEGVDPKLLNEAAALIPETVLGLRRDGKVLRIGSVSRRRRNGIAVPDVLPLAVTVTVGTTSVEVIPPIDGALDVETGTEAVTIRDLRGRTYRLAAFAEGEPAPEEACAEATLTKLEDAWKSGEVLPGHVLRVVAPGRGLIVALGTVEASVFVPASRALLKRFSFTRLTALVNTDIHVRIINVDRPVQRVIAARVEPPFDVSGFVVGDRVEARVDKIVAFGAFLSFPRTPSSSEEDRLTGLLHVSSMDAKVIKGYKKTPPTFPFVVGDTVEVEIDEIDLERRRLSLTRRPWLLEKLSRLEVGQILHGVVVKVVPFGVIVEVAPGITGLLHRSLIPEGMTYERGASIDVRVVDVDEENLKVHLDLP